MSPLGCASNSEKTALSETGAALGAAVEADLAFIIEHWATLASETKAVIVALVKSTKASV